MNFLSNLANGIISNKAFTILCIMILFDTFFGVLRAIKEHSINSAIGIDGVIRKAGMLGSIIFFIAIDILVSINLIGFIPENVRELIHLDYVGFNELFNILFIIFEFLSIMKNMTRCKLPIPKKLQQFMEEAMKKFTGELGKESETNEKRGRH